MYNYTTRSLKITVSPQYQDELSSPLDNYYVWSYNIFIENYGIETVQLLSRYWRIIDSDGNIQEVSGDGVIGQQPLIHPNEYFEYTSHATLKTSSGIMLGCYNMIIPSTQESFEVIIPAFSLDNPYEKMSIN
ncbi:CO2+/MG2+ efflux protein ApaG [Rickettsiales bacterium Ac37b]|nr:CO2+/MG2+ efflux protein ApaG [Rickettsiales bacterium Ac37b]